MSEKSAPKADYDDVVKFVKDAPANLRPDQKAWIVGIFVDRPGRFFERFPQGIVYSIEYEDGSMGPALRCMKRTWSAPDPKQKLEGSHPT
ncbi:hypothetical protein DLREEDagr8_16440 [Dongia sp. agr-C8]